MSFAEKTAELWLEIDQLHLKYLQHDDNVAKIELRKKLEKRVKEYLCLVPQDRKFVASSTGDIISNSARWISEFSLTKAAEAFQCIEQYAANLINQPWRQEYRTIRQFNGFYMHNIKSVLSGAEKLFFSMGYCRDENDPEIFKLPVQRNGEALVNLDAVTQVARDCLLARMESIILQDIYMGVVPQFPLSLDELIEFRRDHIGTADHAIRELLYRKNQGRFQFPGANQPFNGAPQIYSPYMATVPGFTPFHGTPMTAPNSFPPANTNFHPTNTFPPNTNAFQPPTSTFPPQNNMFNSGTFPYSTVQSGQFPAGTPVFQNNPYQTGYMSAFPVNGQLPNAQNGGMNGFPANVSQPNGDARNGLVPVSSVPAGLATTGTRLMEHSPAGSSTSTLRHGQIPTTILDLVDDNRRNENGARPREKPERVKSRDHDAKHDRSTNRHETRKERGRSSRTRNSGGEEIESWDFVYKELEQQGYSKDQAERPDILASNRQSYINSEQSDEDVRRNLNRMHIGENNRDRNKAGRDKSRNRNSREFPVHREITSESEQETSRYSSANSKNTDREYRTPTQERPQRANRGNGQQTQGNQRPRRPESSDQWECSTCTFHNPISSNICEMCSKTRDKSYKDTLMDSVDVKPRKDPPKEQCSRCTLLNPPNTKVCEACGTSLGLTPPV